MGSAVLIAAVAATTAWVVFVVMYLASIGMSGVLAFTPSEIALLLLAAAGPIAVLWLLIGYALQRKQLMTLSRAMVDLGSHGEAQARALLEAKEESRKQSFVASRELAIQDLTAQVALIAERLSLLTRDQADTIWARTGAGDIWGFYLIFLMAQAADPDFPSRLGEAAASDDVSYAAMSAFVRRYTQLAEAQHGFELDKLGRDIIDDGPLAQVASIFQAAELAADAAQNRVTPEPQPEPQLEQMPVQQEPAPPANGEAGQTEMFAAEDPEAEKERLDKIINKLEKVSAAAREQPTQQ